MVKENLNLFFYWILERHSIYLKKESNAPWPWTKDKILQEYKFTNPFRQNDRVTKELVKRLRLGIENDSLEKTLFKIIVFRMFNWPETYDELYNNGLIDEWNTVKAVRVLKSYKDRGGKVFTGAYMMTGSGSSGVGGKTKMACNSIGQIYKQLSKILVNIMLANQLKCATEILCKYEMIGSFVAYEMVTDLRHTTILDHAVDIYDWANPGPGAKRGIHRILFDTVKGDFPTGLTINNNKVKRPDYQYEMQKLLKLTQKRFTNNSKFKDVVFEMRDIEHSLCEFDKYMRVLRNEGKPRSRYVYNKSN